MGTGASPTSPNDSREDHCGEAICLGDAVPHVIRRCATNRLYTAMKALTQIVERFGGKTAMSDERHEEASVSAPKEGCSGSS